MHFIYLPKATCLAQKKLLETLRLFSEPSVFPFLLAPSCSFHSPLQTPSETLQKRGELSPLFAGSVSVFSLFSMCQRKTWRRFSQVSATNKSKMVIRTIRHIDIFRRAVSGCSEMSNEQSSWILRLVGHEVLWDLKAPH